MNDSAVKSRLTIGIELIDDPGWMGGTLYLRNLALCLSRLPEGIRPEIRLLGSPAVVARFRQECGNSPAFGNLSVESAIGRLMRKLGWKERLANEGGIDVVYPGFGAGIPGAVTVRWIPDFQHRYLPHLFSRQEIDARDRSIGDIAANPGVVVFSSEVAAADFRCFYPGHRATPRVWHFCSLVDGPTDTSGNSWRRKYGVPGKYLYMPNQFWVHKNHLVVLKALAMLRADCGLVIPLVCTGAQTDRRNEAHFASLLEFIDMKGIADQVHFLGLLPRSEQIEVLRCAAAVVQPSLFEGWSTVVEDARAVGRPIILSDIPVHREQSPPQATYFPPDSAERIATLLSETWPVLQAGPDADSEHLAHMRMEHLIMSSANEFIDIVRDALVRKEVPSWRQP
jgi:hypothetical protein